MLEGIRWYMKKNKSTAGLGGLELCACEKVLHKVAHCRIKCSDEQKLKRRWRLIPYLRKMTCLARSYLMQSSPEIRKSLNKCPKIGIYLTFWVSVSEHNEQERVPSVVVREVSRVMLGKGAYASVRHSIITLS